MKQLSRLLIVALVAISATACSKDGKLVPVLAPPASVVTQPGKVAYTADQIVLRINELENTAIAGNRDGSVADDIAKPIVQLCVSLDKVAATTPDGLKPALLTGWAELQKDLKGKTLPPTIALAFGAVDGIVTSLTPPPTAATGVAK